MKQINNLSIVNKIALLSLILILIANPWSTGYISYGIDLISIYFVLYSVYAFVGGCVLAMVVIIYFMWNNRDQVNIPDVPSKRPKHIK